MARAVLRGETRGYRHHPQLERFWLHRTPRLAISAYLAGIYIEAEARGYSFDRRKVGAVHPVRPVVVTSRQIAHEWQHLLRKLSERSPAIYGKWRSVSQPECHPLFRRRKGPVASWERLGP